MDSYVDWNNPYDPDKHARDSKLLFCKGFVIANAYISVNEAIEVCYCFN